MSASEETVVVEQQKETDKSVESESKSDRVQEQSAEKTPVRRSPSPENVTDAVTHEPSKDDEQQSDYIEDDAEDIAEDGEADEGEEDADEGEVEGDVDEADGEGDLEDVEGPNVQPLDSSDEERAPDDDDDQLDDPLDSDQESVTVDDEREEGDGQESAPSKEKKLDDDEDRRNPQYIPKRGTFYEHDDRTADDMLETPSKETKIDSRDGKETGKDSGRKVWKDKEDRWQHDRFQEREQTPKSREELVMVYGYDIRNEEAPPKARRRRRYGRGPNKYTRSWEDEEAYNRPLGAFIVEKEGDNKPKPRKPRVAKRGGGVGGGFRNSGNTTNTGDGSSGSSSQKQDFPALSSGPAIKAENGEEKKTVSQPSFSSKVSGASSRTVAGTFNANPKEVVAPFGSQHRQQRTPAQQPPPIQHQTQARQDEEQRKGWRRESNDDVEVISVERVSSRGRGGRPTQVRNRREDEREGHSRWSDQSQTNGQSRGRGGGRGFRRGGNSAHGSQRVHRDHEDGSESDGGHRVYIEEVSRDMSNMGITTHQQPSPGGDYQRRPSNGSANASNGVPDRRQNMPPRMQENAGSRPKRYSSMRARNVPETSPAPPPPVSSSYTPPAPHTYYQPGYGPPPVAPMYQETPALPAASPGHQPTVPSVPTMPTTLPSAIPSTIPCFPQGSFIAPPPGPQARLLPPGSFIPPVPGPAPPFVAATSPQGQYQPLAYQPFQPITMVSGVSQPQPAELYQPQGGITYYSTQNQNIPRAVPQPRVKAAIPILPPPERSSNAGYPESEHVELYESMHDEMSHPSQPTEMIIAMNESNNPQS